MMKNIHFILNGNTKMYSNKDALLVIEYLKKNKILLFGIDGFRILPEGFQIEQDYSLDFGRDPYVNNYTDEAFYDIAKEKIQSIKENVLFEIIHEGEDL